MVAQRGLETTQRAGGPSLSDVDDLVLAYLANDGSRLLAERLYVYY
jgi:hypothetical protein